MSLLFQSRSQGFRGRRVRLLPGENVYQPFCKRNSWNGTASLFAGEKRKGVLYEKGGRSLLFEGLARRHNLRSFRRALKGRNGGEKGMFYTSRKGYPCRGTRKKGVESTRSTFFEEKGGRVRRG